jgi:histidinol-phosphate aminotransferase
VEFFELDKVDVRDDLKSFVGYSAHTSPDYMKKKFGLDSDEIIKLDANENPYGCSPKVIDVLKDISSYSVYPDAAQTKLREKLSAYTSMPMENIVCGCGSDQLIDLIIRLFVNPGDEIITFNPTFSMYSFYGKLAGAKIIEIDRDETFDFYAPGILNRLNKRTRLVFVANPNNPTGNLVSLVNIRSLLTNGIIVVVDEAYYEFCRETVAPWVEKYDNLIVLRTFSKWAGLAGLRIGYGIFPKHLAEYIMRIKDPYAINMAAQNAAIASLEDKDLLMQRVESIVFERDRLFGSLSSLEGLMPYPSSANFILCRLYDRSAAEFSAQLRERGILVRYYNNPGMETLFRVSVGYPEQNDILIESIKEILGEGTQW